MSDRVIWKYPLISVYLDMPMGARVLTVQAQDGRPCIWALVDPDAEKEKRCFLVVGTGASVPQAIEHFPYLGTVQIGAMVWHIFEGPL